MRDLFGKDGELVEEFSAEGFAQTNASEKTAKNILIDSSTNLDTEQGSFVFTQRFQGEKEILSTQNIKPVFPARAIVIP